MELLVHPVYFPNVQTLRCLLEPHVVWEVWDNYQKQTYRNRCYIATDRGKHMLNIPIRHVGGQTGRQRYRDVRIENAYPWQRQHWRSLETAYRSAPFFEYYEARLRPLFEHPYEWLMEWNLESTALLCELIGLVFPQTRTESYEMSEAFPLADSDTDSSAGPSAATQQVQAGPDKDIPNRRDYRWLVSAKNAPESTLPPYPQVFTDRTGFLKNLSGLDLVFNEGNRALDYLQAVPLPVKTHP